MPHRLPTEPTVPSNVASLPGHDFPYELVLNNTIVGVSYMRERTFVWANARMNEIFGYVDGELTGRPVRMLYSTEEDYAEVGRRYARFARDNSYTHERSMVKKNGETLWCLISGRMIDPADPKSPSVWVVQDISARKQAENQLKRANQRLEHAVESRTQNLRRSNDALRLEMVRRRTMQAASVESREKYRALFRHLPLGILVTSADGEIVEINRAMQRFVGATAHAMLATTLADAQRVVLGADRTCSLRSFIHDRTPPDGKRVERNHMIWRGRSGKMTQFEMVASRLSSHGLGAVFTFEDVTEQHRAREREHEQQVVLAHAMRLSLMGQFASALAHELGQPLNACESYLAGIRLRLGNELADRPDVQSALAQISLHLEQADQIVRNVRRFVGRHEPEFEAVDAGDLVIQTLDLLRVQLNASGCSVAVEAPDDLPMVQAHRVEIQQVLVNLLLNALDAMAAEPPARRHVAVRLQREGKGMLCIQVSDNGPGVAPELMKRIFTPYFTTRKDGLGMGLMMCRTIVESHRGAIRCVDTFGAGATFRFTLPVVREAMKESMKETVRDSSTTP